MVLATTLSVVHIDDVHKRWRRYHTRKMPSRRSGSNIYSTTGTLSQKDSYQYDTNSCIMIMNIPPTWHKCDLNANIHGNTWVSHQHNSKQTWQIMTKITSHKWFCITSSTNHENKQEIRSHIKHQTWIYEGKWIAKGLHEQNSYTSHPEAIWRKGCQTGEFSRTINITASNLMEWLLAHWTLTPALCLEKWPKNEMKKMENLNTPSNFWHRIVQNPLLNFWILRKWKSRA